MALHSKATCWHAMSWKRTAIPRTNTCLPLIQPLLCLLGNTIVMQLTGADVIHSWTIPAFGVKQDAVPGRLSQLWFAAEQEGIFFGQCSELCGKDHAYMPITVKVVSQETYDAWLAEAKVQNGV